MKGKDHVTRLACQMGSSERLQLSKAPTTSIAPARTGFLEHSKLGSRMHCKCLHPHQPWEGGPAAPQPQVNPGSQHGAGGRAWGLPGRWAEDRVSWGPWPTGQLAIRSTGTPGKGRRCAREGELRARARAQQKRPVLSCFSLWSLSTRHCLTA